jgi:hypothetical protein
VIRAAYLTVFGSQVLLLCTQRSVLHPHLMAVVFSASCGINVILGAASEAYFEVEPAMLGNLSLERIGDWHFSFTLATVMIVSL